MFLKNIGVYLNMEEKTLLKTALFISFSGILFLFLICSFYKLDLVYIKDIDESYLDKRVRIEGFVENLKEFDSMILFDLKDDSGKIKIVIFSDKRLDLSGFVSVEGKVMEYEGELEIGAEKIKNVS